MNAEGLPLEIWLTLPLLPTGLTADGVQVVRSLIEHGISIRGINGMAMDYGDAAAPQPAGRMGAYAIEAARGLHEQLRALYAASGSPRRPEELWQMIGITPMIGRNDVATETFELSDADQLLNFAAQNHIGALSMWSLNRDRSCEREEPAPSPSCSGITQRPYEFTRILQAFEGLVE
jgi:chitinase